MFKISGKIKILKWINRGGKRVDFWILKLGKVQWKLDVRSSREEDEDRFFIVKEYENIRKKKLRKALNFKKECLTKAENFKKV